LHFTPTDHGQSRVTKTQYQYVEISQYVHDHRNFNVDKPTKHNNMVMIQNLTTTCVSFQPDFSK